MEAFNIYLYVLVMMLKIIPLRAHFWVLSYVTHVGTYLDITDGLAFNDVVMRFTVDVWFCWLSYIDLIISMDIRPIVLLKVVPLPF